VYGGRRGRVQGNRVAAVEITQTLNNTGATNFDFP
jgi:hypothetical protein